MGSASKSGNFFPKERLSCYVFLKFLCIVSFVFSAASVQTTFADTLSGSWSVLAPMPTPTSDTFVAAVNGELYVAGGNTGPTQVNTLLEYDPATNTWTTKAPMPTALYQGSVAVLGSKIYCFGGWDHMYTWLPHTNVQIYDTTTDSWSTGASIPHLSASGEAAAINGKIYLHTPADGYDGAKRLLDMYDPVANSWSSLPNSPSGHSGARRRDWRQVLRWRRL